MAANLTRLTHKIATKLHLVAESCTIYSSRSRRPIRKLLDTLSYVQMEQATIIMVTSGSIQEVPGSNPNNLVTSHPDSDVPFLSLSWRMLGYYLK
jgi:hypothetical protein